MTALESLVIVTVVAATAVTKTGLEDDRFMEKYKFEVDRVLIDKEYYRLLSSAFLHVNWPHFLFNFLSLWAFVGVFEQVLGPGLFALLLLGSAIGGSLVALYLHRMHGDYSAVGASGGVSGVVFAAIVLQPDARLGFMMLPSLNLPAWLFGVALTLASFFAFKAQRDNVGHEAHMGGAMVGIVLVCFFHPQVLTYNWWVVLALLLPSVGLLALMVKIPSWVERFEAYDESEIDAIRKQARKKLSEAEELDELLEKVQQKGFNNLSKKEKRRLEELSRR